jgi:hypothetical protein
MLIPEVVEYSAKCAMTSSGIPPWKSHESENWAQVCGTGHRKAPIYIANSFQYGSENMMSSLRKQSKRTPSTYQQIQQQPPVELLASVVCTTWEPLVL